MLIAVTCVDLGLIWFLIICNNDCRSMIIFPSYCFGWFVFRGLILILWVGCNVVIGVPVWDCYLCRVVWRVFDCFIDCMWLLRVRLW